MNIDKNIPIPQSGGRVRPSLYPFAEMEIGDSVFFPDEPRGSRSKPSIASAQLGRYRGWKFSSRAMDGGVRIWRVA